jgi:cold shock CspA family protein
MSMSQKLTRIGVFYDGNFFRLVSNYYVHSHPRQARISIAGLHNFIRNKVAESEGTDARFCQVIDAHYFRGRLPAREAEERDLLLSERTFEDVLMREGVTTHYMAMGTQGEKGIDVWLALEAFELAIYKRFDVLALIATDGDFVPLVRKLNTLGTRVMLLGWDFAAQDQRGMERTTRTSQALINEVTYPMLMHAVIDDRAQGRDPLINGLFLPREPSATREASAPRQAPVQVVASVSATPPTGWLRGVVQNLKEGYGFLTPEAGGSNLFFAYNALGGLTSENLHIGDSVEYQIGRNAQGPCAIAVRFPIGEDGRIRVRN